MNKQKTIFIIAAVIAAVGLATTTTTVATSNPAYVAIFSVNIGCTNPN